MSLSNTIKSLEKYNKRIFVQPPMRHTVELHESNYKEEVDKLNKLLNELKSEKYEVIEALNSEIDNNLNLEKELYKTKKKTKDEIRVNMEKLEDDFKNVSTVLCLKPTKPTVAKPMTPPKPKKIGRPPKILKDVKIAKK